MFLEPAGIWVLIQFGRKQQKNKNKKVWEQDLPLCGEGIDGFVVTILLRVLIDFYCQKIGALMAELYPGIFNNNGLLDHYHIMLTINEKNWVLDRCGFKYKSYTNKFRCLE